MAKHMADADSDGDGVLTTAELGQAFEARMKAHFTKKDENGDGALSADEVGARHWKHISVADANGDGKVTPDEIETAHANGTLKPPSGGGHFGPGKHGRFGKGPMDPAAFLKDYLGDSGARSKMTYKLRKEEDAVNLWAYLVSLSPEMTN